MGISILVPGVNWASKNLGQVTPTGDIPIQAIAIEGAASVVGSGQYIAALFPAFTTQRGVTWSIVSGSGYATINSNGIVSAKAGALNNSVTIRATSTADSSISADKTISVTSGTFTYYDYLESDGSCYFIVPGGYSFGDSFPAAKIIIRATLTTGNGYAYGSRYNENAQAPKFGLYKRNAGDIGVAMGNANYIATGKFPVAGKVYRVEYNLCSSVNVADGSAFLYDDSNDSLLWSQSNINAYLNGDFCFFVYGYNQAGPGTTMTVGSDTFSANKLYGFEVYDYNNTKIMDLKRTTLDGTPALFDTVSQQVYFNQGAGTVTPGND